MCYVFYLKGKKRVFEDAFARSHHLGMSLLSGTEDSLHGGARQPLVCCLSRVPRNIPTSPTPLPTTEQAEAPVMSGAVPGLSLPSSVPPLASPVSSPTSSSPKTFQPSTLCYWQHPQRNLGLVRHFHFSPPILPPPVCLHTPSATLTPTNLCPLRSLTPFPLSFPSPTSSPPGVTV